MDDQRRFPQRPVVSGIGTPTEKLSWLLDRILHPLLRHVPAHLSSTEELIGILENPSYSFKKADILCSLDVVALYPSIPINSAIQSVMSFVKEHQSEIIDYGLTLPEIEEALNLILKNNIIHFEGDLFLQKKGIAMGNRIAPLIAIIYMHILESKLLATYQLKPTIYKRYIDDILIVWPHGKDTLLEFLNYFNKAEETIKFTMETNEDNGWLNYLRFSLRPEDGFIERKFYRKPSTRPLFIRADSHHPDDIKRNAIINEFSSFDKICNKQEHYESACKTFKSILQDNGYSDDYIDKLQHKSQSIYTFLKFSFPKDRTCLTVQMIIHDFLKKYNTSVDSCPGDGHCLLHAVSKSVNIPINTIICLISVEFKKNTVDYVPLIGSLEEAERQLELYLFYKNYNLPIVDIMPLILSRCLCCDIFVFQADNTNTKTLITHIAHEHSIAPVLVRRNNDHYDALISKNKFSKSMFKTSFHNSLVLKIPYINEQHTREIKDIIRSSNIPVIPIFVSGINLDNLFTSTLHNTNPVCSHRNCPIKSNFCHQKNVVYELTCNICQHKYIGETKRELHHRLNEHFKALKDKRTETSAVAEHFVNNHPTKEIINFPFTVKILNKCRDMPDRCIREACNIRKRQPKLNRNEGWSTLAMNFGDANNFK